MQLIMRNLYFLENFFGPFLLSLIIYFLYILVKLSKQYRKKLIFLKLNSIQVLTILTCAIVPLLVTGPFLPDLLLSSISLWFLYYVFKNKLYYVFKNKFFIFL